MEGTRREVVCFAVRCLWSRRGRHVVGTTRFEKGADRTMQCKNLEAEEGVRWWWWQGGGPRMYSITLNEATIAAICEGETGAYLALHIDQIRSLRYGILEDRMELTHRPLVVYCTDTDPCPQLDLSVRSIVEREIQTIFFRYICLARARLVLEILPSSADNTEFVGYMQDIFDIKESKL
eukprot:403258-Hanusia_phi.AAC.2